MAKRTFPYREERIRPNAAHPDGAVVYRPYVIVKVTASNGTSKDFEMLPDTGADHCMFPLELAGTLGLDYNSMPSVQTNGVGAQNTTYYDTLTIDLGEGIVFTTYACFTSGMNRFGFGLLGRGGFFENCNVEFRQRERIFYVEMSGTDLDRAPR